MYTLLNLMLITGAITMEDFQRSHQLSGFTITVFKASYWAIMALSIILFLYIIVIALSYFLSNVTGADILRVVTLNGLTMAEEGIKKKVITIVIVSLIFVALVISGRYGSLVVSLLTSVFNFIKLMVNY